MYLKGSRSGLRSTLTHLSYRQLWPNETQLRTYTRAIGIWRDDQVSVCADFYRFISHADPFPMTISVISIFPFFHFRPLRAFPFLFFRLRSGFALIDWGGVKKCHSPLLSKTTATPFPDLLMHQFDTPRENPKVIGSNFLELNLAWRRDFLVGFSWNEINVWKFVKNRVLSPETYCGTGIGGRYAT